ncbi:hypothetical protein BGZ82_003007, partial [Podila clonocystis]
MTLPTFLEALFTSDDTNVRRWTGLFYDNDGPARLVQVWSNSLHSGKWDESFVNSAVDVVVERTREHLKKNKVRQPWRLPHTEVTEQKIARYLLDDFGFLEHYAKGAIYLTRLLSDLLKEDVPDQGLSRRARKHRKTCKPTSVRGCIVAMLIFMTSQKVNAFQTVMGIFLHCTGCPKRVLEVLSGLGLSISYSHVQNALRSLTKDARAQVEKAVQENDWYVVYDNINIANKHHHQRADKHDTFENGTAATLILVPKASTNENTDKNTNKNQPTLNVFCPENERPMPEADLFFPDNTDLAVFQCVCRSHISDAIVRSLPEGSSVHAIPIVPITTLRLHKTTALPLQIMKIDESTIAGNLAVLERITTVGLQLPKAWFSDPKNIIVAGDQMTVSRLLTLKVHRAIDPDPYCSLAWVHPTLQLFHLRMNLCGTIFRTHFGSQQFQGTLASISILLGRKRLSREKPDFKAADELLRIVFDSTSQLLWEFLKHDGMSDELEILRVAGIITETLLCPPSLSLYGLPCTTANINALLFLRDVAVYIELDESIKAGDIGRIQHILPTITLMMHGGGNTNYAIELLRLLYGTRQVWTDEWSTAVLSSMLVNPKGIEGGWMPTDMFQENLNYLIKTIFSAKGSNMSWESISKMAAFYGGLVNANMDLQQSIFGICFLFPFCGGDGVKSASNGIKGVSDGVKSAGDGVEGVSNGVEGVSDGVVSAGDGVESAGDGVEGVSDGVESAGDGVESAGDGVEGVSDGVESAGDGVESAGDGVESAGDGVE